MGPWVMRSRPSLQVVAVICCTIVGVVLMIGFRGFHGAGGNAFAGFLLGVLLLVIGLAGIPFMGQQTVSVDPSTRRIDVVDALLVGRRTRCISFDAIKSISVGYLGRRSTYVRNYYLVLHLTDGKDYSLFAPGRFWKGASDRGTVEGWRDRLQSYLVPQEPGGWTGDVWALPASIATMNDVDR